MFCQTNMPPVIWRENQQGSDRVATAAAPLIEKPDGGETRQAILWLNALVNARPLSGTAARQGESEEEAEDSFTYCNGGAKTPRIRKQPVCASPSGNPTLAGAWKSQVPRKTEQCDAHLH